MGPSEPNPLLVKHPTFKYRGDFPERDGPLPVVLTQTQLHEEYRQRAEY